MNGALGWRWPGFWTTERTAKAAPVRDCTSAFARDSSRTVTLSLRRAPCWSKSVPDATRTPSTDVSRASKEPGPNTPSTSQYAAERKAMRSRSRSTTMRTAMDCTRPADFASRPIFFQSTSDTG